MVEKLKNFIHKHRTLEKIVLFAWGIYYIVRAKLVFRKIKYNIAKKAKPKVLILALRTIPTTNLVYFDAIFGHAFRKLDCDVKMLYCDGLLDSCDGETVSRDQKPQCFVCKKFNKLLKGTLGLDWLSFFQYISEKDIEKIKEEVANLNKEELLNYQYLGVKVGVHAQSSAIRYFLSGMIDLNDPRQIAVVREKLVSAMITTKISDEINKKEKPNAIFLLHGIYSTWGPFRDYFFSQENVETVLYGNMPPRFGHFIFNRNNKLNEIVSKEEWSNFSHLSLTKEEEKEIDDYFTNRSKGTIGDQKMYENNFGTKLGGKPLLKSLLGKKYSKRYVMYTNLAWDVAIEGKVSKIFDDVFSWIDTTLEFFKQKKDYQLIKDKVIVELGKFFRPELINRFDEVIVFESLKYIHMVEIVKLQLKGVQKLLEDQDMDFKFSEAAIKEIVRAGFDPIYGARPLRRAIQKLIENPISTMIIESKVKPGDQIVADFDGEKFTFKTEKVEAKAITTQKFSCEKCANEYETETVKNATYFCPKCLFHRV